MDARESRCGGRVGKGPGAEKGWAATWDWRAGRDGEGRGGDVMSTLQNIVIL